LAKPLKIAFVNHPTRIYVPPPKGGSVDICIHEVARRLARACEVMIYTPRGGLPADQWCEGVHYRRVFDPERTTRTLAKIQNYRGGWRATQSLERRLYDFRSNLYYLPYSLAVAKDLRRWHCDLIHLVNLSQFAPLLHAFNPRAKLLLHMHSLWLTLQEPQIIKRRLKRVTSILSCSDFVTKKIRAALPEFSSRAHTLYNGVDTERFCPSPPGPSQDPRGPRIVFASRVSPEKGLHVLLDAFAIVAKRHARAQLEIIGACEEFLLAVLPTVASAEEVSRLTRFYDGQGYLAHLRQQATALALADRVSFPGLLSHQELAERYRRADVFVFPSVCYETFAMPVTEAMAAGMAVVSTRIGGIPEIIEDGKTGILVEPNDPGALAEAILLLIENHSRRQAMGKAARERAARLFSWDRVTEKLLGHYQDICRLTGVP
jgi:glycosyltransferase involved in cell wall biosynthesis